MKPIPVFHTLYAQLEFIRLSSPQFRILHHTGFVIPCICYDYENNTHTYGRHYVPVLHIRKSKNAIRQNFKSQTSGFSLIIQVKIGLMATMRLNHTAFMLFKIGFHGSER